MNIGHEIIQQQIFFRKELTERVYWFIKLRWLAAAAAALGAAAGFFMGYPLPYAPIAGVIIFIALYNLAFIRIGRRLESVRLPEVRPFEIFAHFQVTLDLLALFALICLSGGLSSPLLVFAFFHVILAGILLSPASCYVYALLIVMGLGGIFLWTAPFFSPLPHNGPVPPPPDGVVHYLVFSAGIIIAAFLITSVKVALRSKGRDLMKVSRELEITNTKLTSLYEMIKQIGSHSSLQALMDSATRHAANIMGVKACSIKLLDRERNCLRFAATHGLSEDYLSKDCISLEKSVVNRKIIEGSIYSIGRINEESYFQYPENIRQEGIYSMLCLPLKVDDKILGVLCVYSGEPEYFGESDADFFSLLTDLTALSMERLNREVGKAWFLNKAAHQMRAPLSAIQTLLKLLTGGFVGGLSEEQNQIITRAEKRIQILTGVINDLLKLAAERREGGTPGLRPVDAAAVLAPIIRLYRDQAAAKGVKLDFSREEDLPRIMADESALDELFSNLISNAIKYTPSGGQVGVTLAMTGDDMLMFEVQDTGIGIPEADRSRLFSEFYRSEEAKALVEEGTGLGLAIVKEILERLDGRIAVETQTGRGSRFTCIFPVVST